MGATLNAPVRPRRRLPKPDFNQRGWRQVTGIVLALVAVGGGAALVTHLAQGEPVAKILVEGEFARVTTVQVQVAAQPWLGQSLLRVDINAVREAVEMIPWVARAQVQRRWPDSLGVTVWEHKPVARWGDVAVVTATGEVRAALVSDAEPLPQLRGPEATAKQVLTRYQDVLQWFTPNGYTVTGLTLDDRNEWSVHLLGEREIRFGRKLTSERAARLFGTARKTLSSQWARLAYIDLRYSSGFAVGWHNAAQQHSE